MIAMPESDPATGRTGESPLRVNAAVVVIALLIVTALHYGTPRDPSLTALHDVWRRLYYVPIVLGAFHFGPRGGILTALAATLLYLPHVLWQWGGMAHGNQYLEMVMFNIIGVVTGLLAGELHRQRSDADAAYAKLAESVERSREAERLAAMGQLSAALSHEIRNPLASLKGSLPILLEGIDPDDPRREFAEITRRELDRLEGLTTQFLEYARPPQARWAEDSLADVVDTVYRLIEAEAQRQRVEVVVESDPSLPLVAMDSNRIQQVILNLALNGIQAMPGGGILTLRCGHDDTGVFAEVADEGPGIEPAARERLFEPFFTTKEHGTGLGLAVAHQWVQRHGGRIDVGESASGGARFRVWIPRNRPEPGGMN